MPLYHYAKTLQMLNSASHRFYLDKTSKKHYCPQCNKKRFVKYIDSETEHYLNDTVGRCDREQKCAYHFTPKMLFEQSPNLCPEKSNNWMQPVNIEPEIIDTIPYKYVTKSQAKYDTNNFVVWLHSLFPLDQVKKVCKLYEIGSSKRWDGSTVFWQIDGYGEARQAKVIPYNPKNGKRNKDSGCYFAGKAILKSIGIDEANLVQCFFGQHLIQDSEAIALVESEKTAVIMTLLSWNEFAPKYTYIATGGSNGCKWHTYAVSSCLNEKEVVIIPDVGQYDNWLIKSRSLKASRKTVFDGLESNCSDQDKKEGVDIADVYLRRWKRRNEKQSHGGDRASRQSDDLNTSTKLAEETKPSPIVPEIKVIKILSIEEIYRNRMCDANPKLTRLIDEFEAQIA